MKMLAAALSSFLALSAFAGDVLELPVSSAASTSATHRVTFTLGMVGFLQDVVLHSYAGVDTGTVTIVNDSIGMTNGVGTFVFTPTSQPRITNSFPMQRGDYVQVVYTASVATNATYLNKATCWFKNVTR